MQLETFKKTLQSKQLFVTRERSLLFEKLSRLQSPITITQLAALLSSEMNETTVYRNIELFESLDITTRVYTGWRYKVELSDRFSSHHHHMTCETCGQIISFQESAGFQRELQKLESAYGFRSSSHSLELRGQCKACC